MQKKKREPLKQFKLVQLKELKKDFVSSDFQSMGEARFYEGVVLPMLLTGVLNACLLHEVFEIVPKVKNGKELLRARIYTPDFFLEYSSGKKRVIEIKDPKVRQMQRDYPLRKQLFLLKYCIPNGWLFEEIESKSEYEP